MATMICSRCNRYGIYWENLCGLSPHTYCPHCKSRQAPVPEEREPEEDEEDVAEEEGK